MTIIVQRLSTVPLRRTKIIQLQSFSGEIKLDLYEGYDLMGSLSLDAASWNNLEIAVTIDIDLEGLMSFSCVNKANHSAAIELVLKLQNPW